MPWKPNKRLVAQGFHDLMYLPRARSGWDSTLAALAYGMRLDLDDAPPDLNAWAARHGAAASQRYRQLGADALVLWHGTSRERAEKVIEHGLFHKRGLWTAADPSMAHSFCRSRSDRYATEGAVVCLVLDRSALTEGLDYDVDGPRNVYRFHAGLPPDVVEYVLLDDEILFTGDARAREPRPWTTAKFKRESGEWVPVQKTPVRYSETESYRSVEDFARICVNRLLGELGELTALEVFSALYAAVSPNDALAHAEVFDLIEELCVPHRRRHKWQTYRARASSEALERAV